MKIEQWIKFEKPEEKEEFINLVESFGNAEYSALNAIQERYNLDVVSASRALEIYKERLIRK